MPTAPQTQVQRYFVQAEYQAAPGCRFDFELYRTSHIPLAEKQMALGGLHFLKRIMCREVRDFFTGEPVSMLTLMYVLERESDVKAFLEFMSTDLVQPLIADAAACSDCKILWTTGTVTEF